MNKGKNSTFYQFIPFCFPILSLLILTSNLIGTYSISVAVGILLIGFTYSFIAMISRRGLISAIINMYVIGILIFGSGVMYIMTIASRV
ncbi:hypothetical protein FS935_07050 [Metabacillus litoralis]|uniref:Uncharacterized protein n=1 Tax=Metabacillus litoralis TaxID=152268 RepID=A0A5C6W3Y5_9BACI|nr:hypothetical protein [Metabacillus litoralis]TXC92131.1 hypothetical protein FS935_07050 [Metabacillus litoralis]